MWEAQKEKAREKERIKKQRKRASLSEEQKREAREKERIRVQKQRATFSEEQKEEAREKERIRLQEKRASLSEEQKEEAREKERIRMQEKRASLSEEQKEEAREKKKIYMQIKRATFSEEQKEESRVASRDYMRQMRESYTQEQKEESRAASRVYMRQMRESYTQEESDSARVATRISQRRMRENYTPEQQESLRANDRHNKEMKRYKHNETGPYMSIIFDDLEAEHRQATLNVEDFIKVEQKECMSHLHERLFRTEVRPEEFGFINGHEIHQSLVCIVCDCFIIGTDPIHWIHIDVLKFNANVLSSYYFYEDGINALLKSQYEVDDDPIKDLLLSPRARRNTKDHTFTCCQSCYVHLSSGKKLKQPPKFAISNGFAIGHLPSDVSTGVTPVVNNLVAPVRAFNYFVSFNSGREQKITGNFTFFAQDVTENIGVLQQTASLTTNPCVHVILHGSFTPVQLEKIRKQGIYSIDTFERIYQFLHTNNAFYTEFPSIDNIPRPNVEEIILQEDENINTESAQSNSSDNSPISWRYWFPNVSDPDKVNGSFACQSDFAKALFIGETPTLIYHPSKILFDAKLSQLCPLAFPFGIGDVDVKRKPPVSEVDCLKHYLKLALPQFSEGQIILIIHHMFQRRKSFMTGVTKCNIATNGSTIADQLADISADELNEAIVQMKRTQQSTNENDQLHTSSRVSQLLRCIKTSCVPIGYTNEAASDARNKMFALWMTFGPPSLLFTFSPCDECSFKMHLYATADKVELPSIKDCFEVMSSNLSLRKSLRVHYPGACAREFDNLFQIVIADLLGWHKDSMTSKVGIFGKIKAWAAGIEEQGRTSLHGHTILWVHKFHLLQQQLFSTDINTRTKALDEMKKYMTKVLSSHFDVGEFNIQDQFKHKSSDVDNVDVCDGVINGVLPQNLREMRHRQQLKHNKGVILKCSKCSKVWDTESTINGVINYLLPITKNECPHFWPDDLTLPLKLEQIELLALRYQYDMNSIPLTAENLRRLLKLIVLLFFNTHDWRHRRSCFKKGTECRFNLPQLQCEELQVVYNTDNINDLLDGECASKSTKWFYVDGTYSDICSYDIQPMRKPWDVFVNTYHPTVSELLGYNNNVCMGSISTLYYCTLYTSKSTQDEENYPYLKACEAIYSRIKRVYESGSESGLSSRQTGLRRLLSGINAHISSCVVSATMAWYLVTHGSRFHFSHSFRPLLLSQLEAWYENQPISRRIRYKKKRQQDETDDSAIPSHCDESNAEVWFDSDVNNYLYRPDHPTFQNMSLWEFHSKYDMQTIKPESFMEDGQDNDASEKHFRFQIDHPGCNYCCLVKRSSQIIPQLYYSNAFPDVTSLYITLGDDVENHVKQAREIYALKALLMFLPFRDKSDLLGIHPNLWQSFLYQKQKVINHYDGNTEETKLYSRALQILQNIQDMLNVKKIPSHEDVLKSCTDSIDDFCINDCSLSDDNYISEDVCHSDAQVDLMVSYINGMSQESSIFNNQVIQNQHSKLQTLKPGIISLKPSNFGNITLVNDHIDAKRNVVDNTVQSNHLSRSPSNTQTLVTVITRALDIGDIQIPSETLHRNSTGSDFHLDIASLDSFALDNGLDMKQLIAFQSICSSFILSFLNDPQFNICTDQREQYQILLQQKGASDQLLMCVTGPGGSGKSHVVKCCRIYCKKFCDAIGKPFDFSVFPITATSNSAASLLQGKTIHSVAMLRRNLVSIELSSDVDWTVTKVLIIDEISMAGTDLFPKLDKHLRILTGKRDKMYGGIHIIFFGDFLQLSPVGSFPIYSKFNDIYWHGALNAAIFLDQGNHRFIKDPDWGEILKRIQIGAPTLEDLQKINQRLVSLVPLPDNIDCCETRIVYGCYTNKRRNEITDTCFLNFVKGNEPTFDSNLEPSTLTLLIKGSLSKDGKDMGPEFHKFIWSMCGDDNLSAGSNTKVDPCLKLIQGSPLMINSNTGKDKNLVKGTLGNFVNVRWKSGHQPHLENYHGFKVRAANIADIECIIMRVEADNRIVELRPELTEVDIKHGVLGGKNRLKKFKVLQIPVNLSLATTGHKLQGMTKDILILAELSLVPNWLYVVLSRVTTLKGLYLMKPLTLDMFQPISKQLQQELDFLKNLEAQLMKKLS